MGTWAHSPPVGRAWSEAHDLQTHIEAVASLGRAFGSVLGLGELAAQAGMWHDLGKYARACQAYIAGIGPQTSHKLAGARHALDASEGPLGKILALVIAGHHAGIPAFLAGDHPLRERLQDGRAELEAARRGGRRPACWPRA